MTTIAAILAGLVLVGATTVGVVHAVKDDSHRPTAPNPTSAVVPYGTDT